MAPTNRAPHVGAHRTSGSESTFTRAWIAVGSIPLFFIVAFAVGEGLYALLGYKPEDANAPLWVGLVAGVPAIVLFLVPCAAAVWFGNKARVAGRQAALLPMVIGAVLGLWMVVMNVVSVVAG